MTSTSSPAKNVESPCISVCELNAQNVCIGCWRTLDEISRWWDMSNNEKREVLQKADARSAG
ncbi:hypothetical protein WH50_20230 [Pokkaliibacter plantistimulans]|uniref:DUF1289 domain-containing protein n=1 Tax=Pokkaliibacter plantistimulans TaxID=1635171 RepID=A0ABX5LV55_9GAMM|nr:DUF1289 domain-containing protein [Pokkaliibacter plantistimulans]PXF29480.1 hypothetical protein WH50_20230 [Pokkaliibacter plantistimulans]